MCGSICRGAVALTMHLVASPPHFFLLYISKDKSISLDRVGVNEV